MPPRIRITKEDIINSAVALLKNKGEEAVNARSIASRLGCSTQPIFSNFATMEELYEDVTKAAYEIYFGFLKLETEKGVYPVYKSFGMAYIRFAREERELFKFLFMRDRKGKGFISTADFDESVKMIMDANGVSKEKAELMHLEMWTCVHGIGTMLATSFLELDWELISNMLTDIYQGMRARHLAKEEN